MAITIVLNLAPKTTRQGNGICETSESRLIQMILFLIHTE
jgi:hypothetical protein